MMIAVPPLYSALTTQTFPATTKRISKESLVVSSLLMNVLSTILASGCCRVERMAKCQKGSKRQRSWSDSWLEDDFRLHRTTHFCHILRPAHRQSLGPQRGSFWHFIKILAPPMENGSSSANVRHWDFFMHLCMNKPFLARLMNWFPWIRIDDMLFSSLSMLWFFCVEISLPTPNITVQQGVLTFYGVAEIEATPEEVWKVISNFNTYPSWNEYTPSITNEDGSESANLSVSPQVDKWYTLHYKVDKKDKSQSMKMKLTTFDEQNMTLSWEGHFMPTFLLHAEKVQKVTRIESQNDNNDHGSPIIRTKYEIWETQAGPMAHLVKWVMQSKLQKMNEGIAENLKQYFDARWNPCSLSPLLIAFSSACRPREERGKC